MNSEDVIRQSIETLASLVSNLNPSSESHGLDNERRLTLEELTSIIQKLEVLSGLTSSEFNDTSSEIDYRNMAQLIKDIEPIFLKAQQIELIDDVVYDQVVEELLTVTDLLQEHLDLDSL